MINYLQMYKDFEKKLERQLTSEEIKFLQWVFNRYLKENNQQPA
ncbi:hypothetical protein [Paucisalibacillus globulus]|nr:hypothetical protein [Paucisalibacillus globulus]